MALEEYQRKRRFAQTPEPPPKVERGEGRRFVVQKHRASHLHYDFRLEMDGVLKSWAVPKGPSLDPADKRLAMQVEDHPVSYLEFEGIIPPDNYGAGTVMVWDIGTWEPLGDASEMLRKGDLKFRLRGKKLQGEFVLAHMRSRRPGSKGTEWLLIKKRDQAVQPGYNIDQYDSSALTGRSLSEIAGDQDSAQWQSRPKGRRSSSSRKTAWLAEALAKVREKKGSEDGRRRAAKKTSPQEPSPRSEPTKSEKRAIVPALEELPGARPALMPRAVRPMLATLVDKPFDDPEWLYEVKWDGYRAIAFINHGKLRLVSRNQNDMTADYPELRDLPSYLRARTAVLDGEIVVLDEQGRSSFSLMQQRTEQRALRHQLPILYYVFDLLYLEGYDLMRVDLAKRKELLAGLVMPSAILRYSDHFNDGLKLFAAAAAKGLEGIVAKRRRGCYLQKRSREWLKMKITRRQECVIGGYTDPRGSRQHFGSVVLGLYDQRGRLLHVGQAGSGFTAATHGDLWKRLQKLRTDASPFYGKVESLRPVHYVKPELVAEIRFTEWTHEGPSGSVKMRAPVYQGLRFDKAPRECVFERPKAAVKEAEKAEAGEPA